MPNIYMTDFIDFVTRSGPPKLTKVRQVKEREPYNPAVDFWRPFREGVKDFHRAGGANKAGLDVILARLVDPRKISKYPVALKGYKKFLGRKRCTWFVPPRDRWSFEELDVTVNPDIGLSWDDEDYIIKLYLKGGPIKKASFSTVLDLMKLTFAEEHAEGKKLAILDVSQGKLHVASPGPAVMLPLLHGEARSFVGMWNAL